MQQLIIERQQQGYSPGFSDNRPDRATLALAIEGGGMAGAVSGGMCLFLQQRGYLAAFDYIYGCSAGALNGSYLALNQADQGVKNYLDLADRLLQFRRLLRGRAPLNLDYLFQSVIANRRPLLIERYGPGRPQFRALVLSQDDYKLQARGDFASAQELSDLVRASCTMPLLAGRGQKYKGQVLFDGGLQESIPYQSAIAAGASHVLVLRSQSSAYRKHSYSAVTIAALRSYDRRLAAILRRRPDNYNRQARELLKQQTPLAENCQQITTCQQSGPGFNPGRAAVIAALDAGYQAAKQYFSAADAK